MVYDLESFQLEVAAAVATGVGGRRGRDSYAAGGPRRGSTSDVVTRRRRHPAADQRDRGHGAVGVRLHAGDAAAAAFATTGCRG